jgi:hypothetical protein
MSLFTRIGDMVPRNRHSKPSRARDRGYRFLPLEGEARAVEIKREDEAIERTMKTWGLDLTKRTKEDTP